MEKENKELVSFLPSSDSSRSLGQVQGRIFRDLDGLFHGSQQTLTSLAPQGWAETLWTSDEQLHHHVGIFLHALTWCEEEKKKGGKKSRPMERKIVIIPKRKGESQLECKTPESGIQQLLKHRYIFYPGKADSHFHVSPQQDPGIFNRWIFLNFCAVFHFYSKNSITVKSPAALIHNTHNYTDAVKSP